MDIAPDISGAKEPQAAFLDSSRLAVAFGAGEALYVTVGIESGFGRPVKAADTPGLMLGMRRGPRIAVAGKTIVVSACFGPKMAQDLYAFRSTDEGKTWSAPVRVNDKAASAREGLHAMCASRDGKRVACAWLDDRSGKKELYFSESVDGGATWGKNRLIYHSPDGSICECCHPSLAALQAAGEWKVMWRNSLGGSRDMYAATIHSGESSFEVSDVAKLGNGTWKLNACPMDGGVVAADSSGAILSIWRREDQVYVSSKPNIERPIAKGVQPWMAAERGAACLVWLDRPKGKLWLKIAGYAAASEFMSVEPQVQVADQADDPIITTRDGNRYLIAWNGPIGPQACWFALSVRSKTE